jgi:hypothetical protein
LYHRSRHAALRHCDIAGRKARGEEQGKEVMGKVKGLVQELELGSGSPNDPLFITLFPNSDDGSVMVVQPPVMVELDPRHRRQVYANCIDALEEMIEGLPR